MIEKIRKGRRNTLNYHYQTCILYNICKKKKEIQWWRKHQRTGKNLWTEQQKLQQEQHLKTTIKRNA